MCSMLMVINLIKYKPADKHTWNVRNVLKESGSRPD